jgi:hypothetical protein
LLVVKAIGRGHLGYEWFKLESFLVRQIALLSISVVFTSDLVLNARNKSQINLNIKAPLNFDVDISKRAPKLRQKATYDFDITGLL